MDRKQAKSLLPVIEAFANGKDVQYYDVCRNIWVVEPYPTFDFAYKWRVKPQTVKYRLGLFRDSTSVDDYYVLSITPWGDEKALVSSPFFVRYLTDWIEIEV